MKNSLGIISRYISSFITDVYIDCVFVLEFLLFFTYIFEYGQIPKKPAEVKVFV